MIAFKNVVVRYPGAAAPALAGVSFEATAGKITAVAGPNGSGKSTLVRTLLRRITPESGSVAIDGKDVRELDSRDIARSVAVAPQREEPTFSMRVAEYVALG